MMWNGRRVCVEEIEKGDDEWDRRSGVSIVKGTKGYEAGRKSSCKAGERCCRSVALKGFSKQTACEEAGSGR